MYHMADTRYLEHNDIDLSKYRVYSRLKDNGFIERALIQSNVNIIANICDEQKMLVNLIDDLLYSKHANCKEPDEGDDYDYILIDNLDDCISLQELEKMITSALRTGGHMLILCYSDCIWKFLPMNSTHSITAWFSSIMNGKAVYVHMISRNE